MRQFCPPRSAAAGLTHHDHPDSQFNLIIYQAHSCSLCFMNVSGCRFESCVGYSKIVKREKDRRAWMAEILYRFIHFPRCESFDIFVSLQSHIQIDWISAFCSRVTLSSPTLFLSRLPSLSQSSSRSPPPSLSSMSFNPFSTSRIKPTHSSSPLSFA